MNIKHLYYLKEEMTLESIMDFQRDLYSSVPKDTQIWAHINSYGGSTSVGLKLYDLLQAYPGELVIVGEGNVSSAATLSLFTRHKTYALPNMFSTFHAPSIGCDGKLLDNVTYLKHIDENMFGAVLDIYI